MKIIKIDTQKIHDKESFHDHFKQIFGFPDFYGRNMDAWIDCMTSLDSPEDGMSKITVEKNEVLTLDLENVDGFIRQNRELFDMLVRCSSFVNYRRIEQGGTPVLALSFFLRS